MSVWEKLTPQTVLIVQWHVVRHFSEHKRTRMVPNDV